MQDDAHDTATQTSEKLAAVHERAMRNFNIDVIPQLPVRARALAARRFVDIPGAQWEDEWGVQFENAIRLEINKTARGVRKIENDYRQNRMMVDYRAASTAADAETANTLDGMYRADCYEFNAQQAKDNAFCEMVRGGFGAYRLTTCYSDEYNPDDDTMRVNPGLIITDADQCVFFDANAKTYDKRDARRAYVLIQNTKDAFIEEWGENRISAWPEGARRPSYDWYRPDIVRTCEYYEVEEATETLYILTHVLTQETERFFKTGITPEKLAEMQGQGWSMRQRRIPRRRIHKYIMSGAEVLKDCGRVTGVRIPIVPMYGTRSIIDGIEHFKGHVQDRMDPQRLYNSSVSNVAETNALSPREVPIFLSEQMPPHIADLWAKMNIERHPYAVVNPVIDPVTGQIVAMGPIGKVDPPQLAPAQAALVQIAGADLVEDDQDGADEVKANVSAESMDIAATRIDAKSGIYIDNARLSEQCAGEIYQGMAAEVYFEEGRKVAIMSEDDDHSEALLHEPYTDEAGKHSIRNVIGRGKFKVIASVSEATATRRDKTVRSSLHIAQVAQAAGETGLAKAALLTAVMNQDGEGMDDMQKYARRQAIEIGLTPPNEEEQAAMAEAAQQQQPDPATTALLAQAKDLEASAGLKVAQTGKAVADTRLSQAKTVETLVNARQTNDNPSTPWLDAARR